MAALATFFNTLLMDNFIRPDWPAPTGVHALITTRAGGISKPPYASLNLGLSVGDDPLAVAENRARVGLYLPGEPRWLRQMHGNRVVCADEQQAIPEADASVTRKTGTVLAIQMADCMPVLLCDVAGGVIGAAHAGWRGLSGGVIESTVQAMNLPGESLQAYLGPAIGPDNFEVGAEVRETFCRHDPQAELHFRPRQNRKWLADLYGLARQRLAALGVKQVYGGGFCTMADEARFFSYRRDGVTGRMAALIWLGPVHP